jgi:hypothetical protein
MTIRTTSKTVIFHHPFVLSGLDESQPAGIYRVETDDEQMEDVSFLAFRRVSTLIHLHPSRSAPGIRQTMTIDPNELDQALARDGEMERRVTASADGDGAKEPYDGRGRR